MLHKILIILLLSLNLVANGLSQKSATQIEVELQNENLDFNKLDFNRDNRGDFIVSKDKKSFYSYEPLSKYQFKQIGINSTKVISKHSFKSTKDAYLEFINSSKNMIINKYKEKLINLQKEDSICVDEEHKLIYYGNKQNQIVAYDYKNEKIKFTSATLLAVEEYSTINVLKLNKEKTKLIGGFDDNLGVFDIKSKKLKYFGSLYLGVNDIDISPNFKYIIASGKGELKIYDYKTLEIKKVLEVKSNGFAESFHDGIDTVKFLDDDRFLYASSLEGVRLAQISTNKMLREYKNHKKGHWLKKVSQDKLAIISTSATIYNYDLKKEKFIDVDKIPLKNIKRVESNRKNRLLFSQRDGEFLLLDMATKHWKDYGISFREHYTARFALHPTQDKFARLSSNGAMQIFDMRSGKETLRIENKLFDSSQTFAFLDDRFIIHSSGQSAYTKDGDYATEESAKPYLQFIDTKTKKIFETKTHIDVVNSFEITQDKKHLITASADRTIKLWSLDLQNIKNSKVLDTALGDESEIYSIRLNDAQTQLVSFGKNGTVFIRDIDLQKGKFGKKVKVLKGKFSKNATAKRRVWDEVVDWYHIDINYSDGILYDNDTKIIISDSFGNIDFYDLKTKKVLYRIMIFSLRDWIKIYPNGTFESSKNGYKYLDDKFYDIFVKDEIVLQDKLVDEFEVHKPPKQEKESGSTWFTVLIFGSFGVVIFALSYISSRRK